MSVAPWSNDISITALEKGPQQGRLQRPAFSDSVDDGFFAAMNIRLLAGRVFDPARDAPDGGTHPIPIVIDSAFAAQLGYRMPQAAVDQILYMPTDPDHTVPVTVIGVVEGKPLHFAGMGTSASLYFQTAQPQEILIRLSRNDVSGGLAAVRALWERMAPGQDFRYAFEDQLFQEGYATFGSVGQAFAGIALFAFAISIIGLIGMAAHAASRRRHEIGVRKTLGAGTGRILAMLLKDFSKPVLIANLVAWPLAYVAAGAYLNLFLHRIALTPLPFALSLVISLIAAWASIGFQSWRAARVKPAQVLRYE
jgi:putative ABC transport system permease protein